MILGRCRRKQSQAWQSEHLVPPPFPPLLPFHSLCLSVSFSHTLEVKDFAATSPGISIRRKNTDQGRKSQSSREDSDWSTWNGVSILDQNILHTGERNVKIGSAWSDGLVCDLEVTGVFL